MGLRITRSDTNNEEGVGMWDKDKFVGWLSVGAMMMNILAQLRLGDKEIWGKIETTKEFEWEKRRGTYYQGTITIHTPGLMCFFLLRPRVECVPALRVLP